MKLALERMVTIPVETVNAENLSPALDIQADGSVIVASCITLSLFRFTTEGVTDKSFGDEGNILHEESVHGSSPTFVAVQPDNKIIVATHGCGEIKILRLNSDGSPDAGFFERNIRITGAEECVYEILVQSDGKILLSGCTGDDVYQGDHFVMRLQENGDPDLDFCRIGRIISPCSYYLYLCHSTAVQPDGKILVVGIKRHAQMYNAVGSEPKYTLIRYHTDGSLDANFCYEGIFHVPQMAGEVDDFVVLPDGKMILAHGFYCSDSDVNRILVCYNPDGSMHQDFGESGIIYIPVPLYEGMSLNFRCDGALVLRGFQTGGESGGSLIALVYRLRGEQWISTTILDL
jgi:uncharacterized delta-60 repeat protein